MKPLLLALPFLSIIPGRILAQDPRSLLSRAASEIQRKDYRAAAATYGRYLEVQPADQKIRAYRDLVLKQLPRDPRSGFYAGLGLAWLPSLEAGDLMSWIPPQASKSGSVQALAPALLLGWHSRGGLGISGPVVSGWSKGYSYTYANLGGAGQMYLGLWSLGPSYRRDFGGRWSAGADLGAGQGFFQLASNFSQDGTGTGTMNGQGQCWAMNLGAWGEWRPWAWLSLRLSAAYQRAELSNLEVVVRNIDPASNVESFGAGSLPKAGGGTAGFSQSGPRFEASFLSRF